RVKENPTCEKKNSSSLHGATSNSSSQNQNYQPQSVAGDRVKGKGGWPLQLGSPLIPSARREGEPLAVCEKKFPL
ncbi:hypothetical protein, partial [uncultured Fibrobacter sp.]|uniref:hypothetical protein n=1 Tax=uncultured Fibrobacter sp. TaxID=261512 RepID=UPI0025939BB6